MDTIVKQLHTLREANDTLARFVPNVRVAEGYTLNRMRALMGFLGNPQNSLETIHVAGTSGKTSTAYYTAALLRSAGQKTGLTVSPHVDQVNERVQIDLIPLGEAEFCSELSEFLSLVRRSGLSPSYFECLMAFAFWEFARQHVDYAVIEVGLGGLLDGSNVIDRTDKVCIITDIGLDHTNLLGNTLVEIAVQKAGIIQPGNEVFAHRQGQAVMDVFADRCREQHAQLHIASDDTKRDLAFLPLFQQRNFTLAETAVQFVSERDSLPQLSEVQRLSAARTTVPARMEVFEHDGKTIILDGAHNAQKLTALFQSIRQKYPGQPIAALVSFMEGRDFRLEAGIGTVMSHVERIIITRFSGGQDLPHGAVDPAHIVALTEGKSFSNIEVVEKPTHALERLLQAPEPLLLVTGSFFLMHEVRTLIARL